MENNFVPFKESIILKELGFDEECLKLYIDNTLQNFSNENQDYIKNSDFEDKYITAPLYQQVFKRFRDKYHIHGEPFIKGV